MASGNDDIHTKGQSLFWPRSELGTFIKNQVRCHSVRIPIGLHIGCWFPEDFYQLSGVCNEVRVLTVQIGLCYHAWAPEAGTGDPLRTGAIN
jgi:hypothetical protein